MDIFVVFCLVALVVTSLNSKAKQAMKQGQTRKTTFDERGDQQPPKPEPKPHVQSAPKPVQSMSKPAPAGSAQHRGVDGRLHATDRLVGSRLEDIAKHRPKRLSEAQNGEDPCHEYMLDNKNLPLREDTLAVDAQPAAQLNITDDVVRGVIWAEIMTRPAQRNALRRR